MERVEAMGMKVKKFLLCCKKQDHVVDTTGVGDGYTAGFITSYLRYSDVERAMKAGTRYASKIVKKIGAN